MEAMPIAPSDKICLGPNQQEKPNENETDREKYVRQ